MLYDKLFGIFKPLIQIESPDDCLESVSEDIRVLMTLRIVLTTRDLYRLSEMKSVSNLSEVATSHKSRSYIGELSLRLLRELME